MLDASLLRSQLNLLAEKGIGRRWCSVFGLLISGAGLLKEGEQNKCPFINISSVSINIFARVLYK